MRFELCVMGCLAEEGVSLGGPANRYAKRITNYV